MTTILVTGAAGLLGGEVAAALAARGHGVIGLVRKNRTVRHGDGEEIETRDWNGSAPAPGEVALVTGDVGEPHLGLAEQDWRELAAQAETILHCAAVVAFDAAPEIYAAVNVGGTRHMLDLARLRPGGPAGFVHVSTAYVCGERQGEVAEDGGEAPVHFANPYEASKAEAESLVRQAIVGGMPAALARPSIIVGRQSDGAIGAFDSIYMAFRLLAEGRIRTIPAEPGATLNFVPLDHVVKGLVRIAERIEEASGRAFHLVAGSPMPVDDFFALVRSYPQFANPELVTPERFDLDMLSPAERRFHRRVAVLYSSYFQRNPLFLEDNIEKLLGRSGPAANGEMMRRQIDFAIRAGFLPVESVTA
ncbi:SDR family oxidoreductase [Parasphingopyxis marina]|uniref:SDR family oxidoreductase n=1 Tax=Parasphingopyxis marina TaxID=2761622 RepID=UPI001F35E60B|nr:SDR family oxidoreductase [Parasphingopyxis marina]